MEILEFAVISVLGIGMLIFLFGFGGLVLLMLQAK